MRSQQLAVSIHLAVKIGLKGKAGPHSEYTARLGTYQNRDCYQDLVAMDFGNLPRFAKGNPAKFWDAADRFERANGSAYREFEVSLSRKMTPAQWEKLIVEFVEQEIGIRHVFQWAIHCPIAALDAGEQPHAHIMFSDRTLDGIERGPHDFFMRANTKHPDRGGCKKANIARSFADRKANLVALRARWADLQNKHLAMYGYDDRVDHRSLADRGIQRAPEQHLGPLIVGKMRQQTKRLFLERRAVNHLHDLAHAQSLVEPSNRHTLGHSDPENAAQSISIVADAAEDTKARQEDGLIISNETTASMPSVLQYQTMAVASAPQMLAEATTDVALSSEGQIEISKDGIDAIQIAQPNACSPGDTLLEKRADGDSKASKTADLPCQGSEKKVDNPATSMPIEPLPQTLAKPRIVVKAAATRPLSDTAEQNSNGDRLQQRKEIDRKQTVESAFPAAAEDNDGLSNPVKKSIIKVKSPRRLVGKAQSVLTELNETSPLFSDFESGQRKQTHDIKESQLDATDKVLELDDARVKLVCSENAADACPAENVVEATEIDDLDGSNSDLGQSTSHGYDEAEDEDYFSEPKNQSENGYDGP